jgi:hypothetical protein
MMIKSMFSWGSVLFMLDKDETCKLYFCHIIQSHLKDSILKAILKQRKQGNISCFKDCFDKIQLSFCPVKHQWCYCLTNIYYSIIYRKLWIFMKHIDVNGNKYLTFHYKHNFWKRLSDFK